MKVLLSFFLFNIFCFGQTPGSGVTDIDGNQYSTIIIGTQEWMAENLRTTKYNNGEFIPNYTDNAQWEGVSTGAWCEYNNDSQFENPYGKLYNWYTVADPRNVCPTGWHVPSDSEWSILFNYLDPNTNGNSNTAGGKMKSSGTQYWQSPNTDATNESGFSGLPGGGRVDGEFYFLGSNGKWWSSSECINPVSAFYCGLAYEHGYAGKYDYNKTDGFSVRCLKGTSLGLFELNSEKSKLVKIVDLLGRETEFKTNTILIYVYSNGNTEKVFKLE